MTYSLSQRAIDDFKRIYLGEFGEKLSNTEAKEIAVRLLRLFSLLLDQPVSTRQPH